MKTQVSLATVNANRVRMGLEPFAVMPGTMRPGKTARKNRAAQNANKAAHAAACQELKSLRSSGRKAK